MDPQPVSFQTMNRVRINDEKNEIFYNIASEDSSLNLA